jgi:hypothetical protein
MAINHLDGLSGFQFRNTSVKPFEELVTRNALTALDLLLGLVKIWFHPLELVRHLLGGEGHSHSSYIA